MPDRDWYDNRLPKHWRRVARRIEAGADFARVSDLAMDALATTIREAGGVPGLDDFVDVVHMLAGANCLYVHGNGVGALNLPYTAAQHGTHMTRAMHPVALADTAAWLSTYLGRPFRVAGSALGLTKAQASQVIAEANLGHLASSSFSCDGFQRVAGKPQGGVCTSCLLRRQALFASGLSRFDDPRRYRFDVTAPNADLPARHRLGLYLMLDQLGVLDRCLTASDPWLALVEAFPALHELEARAADWQRVGGPERPSVTLPKLYRAYVREWAHFPVGAPWSGSAGLATAA